MSRRSRRKGRTSRARSRRRWPSRTRSRRHDSGRRFPRSRIPTSSPSSCRRTDVTVNAKPLDRGSPWWQTLLFGFGPTILFVLLLFWLFRRAGNVQNALGSFGRSRARRYEPSGDKVTFADVAGIDEAKDELSEVVDFLKKPEKYRRVGGRIPHGVLLSGQPGTGKTLLARAVAGEAGVPFFSHGGLGVRRGDRRRRRGARA